jgi:DNA-binding SARP family transcriptional activator
LGGFSLTVTDISVAVHETPAKVLAAIALYRRPMPRSVLAGWFWPERAADRARANLRSAMWRLPPPARTLIIDEGDCLSLARSVDVDVDRMVDRAQSILQIEAAGATPVSTAADPLSWNLSGEDLLLDLLPTWDDEWVLLERARLRQLRLHALEALARRLLALGRTAEAVDAASAALREEPLRESAASALVVAHLAAGNVADAHRVYTRYRTDLETEMGITPSARFAELLHANRATTLP